jgi:hypothetical protein
VRVVILYRKETVIKMLNINNYMILGNQIRQV